MVSVKDYLSKAGVSYKIFTHPPVYTCEQADEYNQDIRGIHSKNLFLKNRKSKRFYLVIAPADRKVDLKELGGILEDRIKFASENDLIEILKLTPGSVSPFGLINDKENKVKVLIDKDVWDSDFVSFHPNVNTETLELNKDNFHKFIKSLPNELTII